MFNSPAIFITLALPLSRTIYFAYLMFSLVKEAAGRPGRDNDLSTILQGFVQIVRLVFDKIELL